MLPDVLAPDLNVVYCGTAVGNTSAILQRYYAGPGNKFWRVLYEVGLTDRQLDPSEYAELLEYGIGLTDLVKNRSGSDSDLMNSDFNSSDLAEKIRLFHPRVVCFNGKKTAKVFFNTNWIEYGFHPQALEGTRFFTAPSTSGAANAFWDIKKMERIG